MKKETTFGELPIGATFMVYVGPDKVRAQKTSDTHIATTTLRGEPMSMKLGPLNEVWDVTLPDDWNTYYSDGMWKALMGNLFENKSTVAANRAAEEALEIVRDKGHPQYAVLMLLANANDLDVVHRACAKELGMTEKVAELDAWIAKKADRRAVRGHSSQYPYGEH